MKYSVLMSVYKNDDPAFLSLALKSVYEDQTKKPDEIVIVFDGPLNNELYSSIENFAQDKKDIVHCLRINENQGLGEALRLGSALCTGNYIFRMDADDVSHPERFEKQANYLEAHPEIDVLGTDIAEFYDHTSEANLRIRTCPVKHDDIVMRAKRRNPMNHVTACIKTSALHQCGGYENILLLEDYFLWLKMITSGCTLANLNESLVYVRIGNGFHSKRGSKVRIQGWDFLQQYMIGKHFISKRMAMLNRLYIRGFTYCPNWLRKIIYDKVLRD